MEKHNASQYPSKFILGDWTCFQVLLVGYVDSGIVAVCGGSGDVRVAALQTLGSSEYVYPFLILPI